MPAILESETRPGRFTLPWDLGEWASRPQILGWAQEEVSTLDWQNPDLSALMAASPSWQPRFHLVLLVYAYALGICDAEEAADLCYTDASIKSAFPGQAPQGKGLTRFRRENHGLLRWGLEQVFKRALKARFDLGDGLVPAGLKRLIRDTATSRLDAARHLDRGTHDE